MEADKLLGQFFLRSWYARALVLLRAVFWSMALSAVTQVQEFYAAVEG